MKDYVRKNISPEMMEEFRKEYPNITDEQIVEAVAETFEKVGGIVIRLVTQMWDVLKEATKDLTVEDLKQFMEDKKKKENHDDVIDSFRYSLEKVTDCKYRRVSSGDEGTNCYVCNNPKLPAHIDDRFVDDAICGKCKSFQRLIDADDYADRILDEVNKKERNIRGGL